MPQNQLLRAGPLQAKPAAIETRGFVLIVVIAIAIITNDVAAGIVVLFSIEIRGNAAHAAHSQGLQTPQALVERLARFAIINVAPGHNS